MKNKMIGMIHVRPAGNRAPLSEGARGAYAMALCYAEDASEYRQLVEAALSADDIQLLEIDDLHDLDEYIRINECPEGLQDMAERLGTDDAIQFGTFFNYFYEDC